VDAAADPRSGDPVDGSCPPIGGHELSTRLAVSGRTMPDAVVSSSSIAFTISRSP
jgi:hypothetical protein